MRLPASALPSFVRFGIALITLATGCSSSSSDTPVDAGSNASAQLCAKNTDCDSKVCNVGLKTCAVATTTDGAQNVDETDIDCGGSVAKKCGDLSRCKVGGDCLDGVCADKGSDLLCQAPTTTDAVKNGSETGVDCGGIGNPTCADGQGCTARADCTETVCTANVCVAPTAADGLKDDTETDVDCGGAAALPGAPTEACLLPRDCDSSVCTTLVCQAPNAHDTVKSGTVAVPGRTTSRGRSGHADLVGNLIEMTSNINYDADPTQASSAWARNGSWEVDRYLTSGNWGSYDLMDQYGKQGLRCAYP